MIYIYLCYVLCAFLFVSLFLFSNALTRLRQLELIYYMTTYLFSYLSIYLSIRKSKTDIQCVMKWQVCCKMCFFSSINDTFWSVRNIYICMRLLILVSFYSYFYYICTSRQYCSLSVYSLVSHTHRHTLKVTCFLFTKYSTQYVCKKLLVFLCNS